MRFLTQIYELKSRIHNYEKDNDKGSSFKKLNCSENSNNLEEKLLKYELMIEDLQLKQKLKEEEKK